MAEKLSFIYNVWATTWELFDKLWLFFLLRHGRSDPKLEFSALFRKLLRFSLQHLPLIIIYLGSTSEPRPEYKSGGLALKCRLEIMLEARDRAGQK